MKKYIYVLLVTFFVLSCNNDDDRSSNNEPTLNGSWSVINVIGGLAGIDDNYEEDVIVWNFDEQTQELTVTNNNVELVIYDGLASGIYSYEVLIEDENTSLIIDGIIYDLSILTETSLVLDEGAFTSDGFQLTFSR
nr:hypothetical protein [uncultured Psychroserpens sp.]